MGTLRAPSSSLAPSGFPRGGVRCSTGNNSVRPGTCCTGSCAGGSPSATGCCFASRKASPEVGACVADKNKPSACSPRDSWALSDASNVRRMGSPIDSRKGSPIDSHPCSPMATRTRSRGGASPLVDEPCFVSKKASSDTGAGRMDRNSPASSP
eukprot:scaffold3323_cov279-Pinguiococcus_pyrenoidosus.AAC.4